MRVLISAGGTGGHIYPALTLAKYLKMGDDHCEILFIGSKNHMESNIIPDAGYAFKGIEAAGLRGNYFTKAMALFTAFRSMFDCRKIISQFSPDVVVTFGGYVTVPVGMAAHFEKVPLIVHEQNSFLGKANKLLSKYAKEVVVCYEDVLSQLKENQGMLLGNPRATEMADFPLVSGLLTKIGLREDKKTIMIVMGSQGSESMNKIIVNTLVKLVKKPYQVIFVTGKKHYESISSQAIQSDNICVIDYIDQMQYLKVIDLMIARGGATTAAEIMVAGVPSIIIPSPYVPNNHQYLNAVEMEKVGAIRIIEEVNMNESVLMSIIDAILISEEKCQEMKKATLSLARPNAVHDLICVIDEVVHGKKEE